MPKSGASAQHFIQLSLLGTLEHLKSPDATINVLTVWTVNGLKCVFFFKLLGTVSPLIKLPLFRLSVLVYDGHIVLNINGVNTFNDQWIKIRLNLNWLTDIGIGQSDFFKTIIE